MKVTAFAPATVANVAVGFDILGFAIHELGDTVAVSKLSRKAVKITCDNKEIPLEADKNTAGIALLKMMKDLKLPHGFKVHIQKGIPLSSGLGGSAASAVAAVLAANELLDKKLEKVNLIKYAAAGDGHTDNVAPSMLGGLVLCGAGSSYINLPICPSIHYVVITPNVKINTVESRLALKAQVKLTDHVLQSANLSSFVSACHTDDFDLMQRSLRDVIIEPQRSNLIPDFHSLKSIALVYGALGCSISGSGPSIFSLTRNQAGAMRIAIQSVLIMKDLLAHQVKIGSIIQPGARILEIR